MEYKKDARELLRLRWVVSSAQFSSNPWRSLRSVFVSQEIASYETKNRRPVKTCGCISGSPVLSLLSLSIHANHILFFEYANIRHMSIIMPHIIAIFICMVVIWVITASSLLPWYGKTEVLYVAYCTSHGLICQAIIHNFLDFSSFSCIMSL